MKSLKNILVIGATGGSGTKTVEALVKMGYRVTALSRRASYRFDTNINSIDGSALDKDVLRKAITGQDAVIITLGISENPILARLFGPKTTPMNIRSLGTEYVIDVMKELGVERLVVQTSYGSGPSKHMLRFIDRLFFALFIKPQIEDTDIQDNLVRNSGLVWTIVQPVHLNDDLKDAQLWTSFNFDVQQWAITRKLVGEFNSMAVEDRTTIYQTMTLSTIS